MKRALSAMMICFLMFLSACSMAAAPLTVKTNVQKISADDFHTAAIKEDGTVVVVGRDTDYTQSDVSSWKDIVSISSDNYHIVGL